jgi:hypothetical protein
MPQSGITEALKTETAEAVSINLVGHATLLLMLRGSDSLRALMSNRIALASAHFANEKRSLRGKESIIKDWGSVRPREAV